MKSKPTKPIAIRSNLSSVSTNPHLEIKRRRAFPTTVPVTEILPWSNSDKTCHGPIFKARNHFKNRRGVFRRCTFSCFLSLVFTLFSIGYRLELRSNMGEHFRGQDQKMGNRSEIDSLARCKSTHLVDEKFQRRKHTSKFDKSQITRRLIRHSFDDVSVSMHFTLFRTERRAQSAQIKPLTFISKYLFIRAKSPWFRPMKLA